ncbi:hypothetical protein N0V87_002418 [Didymella glomerata]|uniref:Complex 1 LYR protein domain-containing protein n=1 Tax=Didymella glomerata TaxID=749621 RepID=A0A9W8X529_9PLEO|nr:hypothetical protein N0V87_002418 [Didymella glomerata]
MTPGRISPHSPPTPALTPTQKGPFMSPTEYEAFKRQRLAQAKSKRSVRSRNTHESTPAQSRDHSPATTTSYNGQMGGRFLQDDVMSEEYLDKSTPSHRSFASDDTGGQREDLGPFPPHPFTTYNFVLSPYRTVKEKPANTRSHFREFARAEFHKNQGVGKKDFGTIEYLLRRGRRQLETYQDPGIRDLH